VDRDTVIEALDDMIGDYESNLRARQSRIDELLNGCTECSSNKKALDYWRRKALLAEDAVKGLKVTLDAFVNEAKS
jgi:hypothetical protein